MSANVSVLSLCLAASQEASPPSASRGQSCTAGCAPETGGTPSTPSLCRHVTSSGLLSWQLRCSAHRRRLSSLLTPLPPCREILLGKPPPHSHRHIFCLSQPPPCLLFHQTHAFTYPQRTHRTAVVSRKRNFFLWFLLLKLIKKKKTTTRDTYRNACLQNSDNVSMPRQR